MFKVVVMLGPPGSGKGTQAKKLATYLNIPHISTGDMLREAVAQGSELGNRARVIMEAGQLVPDEVADGIVGQRVEGPDARNGFILDGYPRTLGQARFLERLVGGRRTVALKIEVGEEDLVRRLSGRRTCQARGHIFHVESSPSAAGDVCDQDGSPLIQRPDDREEVVRQRLKVYRRDTAPLIDYFRGRPGFHRIDGARRREEIFEELQGIVDQE